MFHIIYFIFISFFIIKFTVIYDSYLVYYRIYIQLIKEQKIYLFSELYHLVLIIYRLYLFFFFHVKVKISLHLHLLYVRIMKIFFVSITAIYYFQIIVQNKLLCVEFYHVLYLCCILLDICQIFIPVYELGARIINFHIISYVFFILVVIVFEKMIVIIKIDIALRYEL